MNDAVLVSLQDMTIKEILESAVFIPCQRLMAFCFMNVI